MTDLEKRAAERRKNITIKQMHLHDEKHHSFHIGLNCTDAWNLLYTMSIKKWEEENNQVAPLSVDKTSYKFINLKDK